LNERELEVITRHLAELIDLLHKESASDHEGRRLHEITFVLAPTQPVRRGR